MAPMIAYCGLVCSDCPSFLATKNDDDVAREKTAVLYAEKFGLHLKPEEINCDGCLSQRARLLEFCQICVIRKCCSEKGLANCASCNDQPCAELSKFHEFSPDAKGAFEALKGEGIS